jgi:glycerol-3-phosphate dehydrogenase
MDLESVISHEDVVHLDDLLFRRTNLAMLGRATESKVNELADTAAGVLGWDDEQKKDEISRVKDILLHSHRMDFTRLADQGTKAAIVVNEKSLAR